MLITFRLLAWPLPPMADYKCPGVYGGARQCIPKNKQLHLLATILVVIATENNVRGQTLKVTEVDVADINGLILSWVKGSRSPKLVSVLFPFGASDAHPNGPGSTNGGHLYRPRQPPGISKAHLTFKNSSGGPH